MYIMNEQEFINEILIEKKKPGEVSMKYLITLLAKKYINENHIYYNDLSNAIKAKLNEFRIDGYQEYLFAKTINMIAHKLSDNPEMTAFKILDYVPIYQSEIDKISLLDTYRKKKFLFTVYAIARYMDSNGWINKKDLSGIGEVFKLANIQMTQKEKLDLIHDLYVKGFITFSKRIDNMNIHVDLSDGENDEIAYKIYEFKNLGNQYIGNFRNGYKLCEICGKKIKIRNNRHKYCDACAREKILKTQRESMKRLRKA